MRQALNRSTGGIGPLYKQMDTQKIVDRIRKKTTKLLADKKYVSREIYKEGLDARPLFSRDDILLHIPEGKGDGPLWLRDVEIPNHPGSVLLIGNAGSGKSLIMRKAYCAAAETHIRENQESVPLWLDLKSVARGSEAIANALDNENDSLWSHQKATPEKSVQVFFDSLDERMQVDPLFINDFTQFLRTSFSDNCRVVIACRRSIFRSDWFDDIDLSLFHCDYLPRDCYREIIKNDKKLGQFFEKIHQMGLASLLENPFDGFDLARRFNKGEHLPDTRFELLRLRVDEHLKGHDEGKGGRLSPPLSTIHEIASRLACVVAFSAKQAGFCEQQAVDIVNSSGTSEIAPSDVRQALSRPLFSQERGRFTFVHQLMMEFLTAKKLQNLSLKKQIQLLRAGGVGGSNSIRPSYRGIAAFLAGGNEEFIRWLLANDPVTLLVSEVILPEAVPIENFLKTFIADCCEKRRAKNDSLSSACPRKTSVAVLTQPPRRQPEETTGCVLSCAALKASV